MVLSSGLATLRDLKTVYDSEDLYILLEVASVTNWNMAQARNTPESHMASLSGGWQTSFETSGKERP